MKKLILASTLLCGCTPLLTPDEFSIFGAYGQSEADGSSSADWGWGTIPSSISSDGDFWFAGGMLTFDLGDSNESPRRDRHGHPR